MATRTLGTSYLTRLTNANHDGVTQQIDDRLQAFESDNQMLVAAASGVHQARQAEDAAYRRFSGKDFASDDLKTPQYVYIYGSQTASSSAKRRAQGSQENTVKIYNVKWAAVDTSGITAAAQGSDAEARLFFTPDGKATAAPQRGINIVRMSDGTVKRIMVK